MILFSIITFIISFFVFAYYYHKGNSETKWIDMSSDEYLIGYFGSLIILFVSFLFILYTVVNIIFDGITKLGSFGLVVFFGALLFLIYKLNNSLKKNKKIK